jgi:hypothetical protein
MNARIPGLAAASVLIVGCTTQRAEPPAEQPPLLRGTVTQSSPPRFQPPPQGSGFKACQLGTSCLTLDPRPFELCLLDSKHCADKVTEPLLVVDELPAIPAEQR